MMVDLSSFLERRDFVCITFFQAKYKELLGYSTFENFGENEEKSYKVFWMIIINFLSLYKIPLSTSYNWSWVLRFYDIFHCNFLYLYIISIDCTYCSICIIIKYFINVVRGNNQETSMFIAPNSNNDKYMTFYLC